MNTKILTLIYLIALFTAGCANVPESSKPPESVFEKAKKAFGQDRAVLVWVPSNDALTSSAAPSRMARDLARMLSIGATARTAVVVAGPRSGKTRRIVIDALSLQKEQLPDLKLLFIGDLSDKEAVRAAVEAQGGKFFFEPYESAATQTPEVTGSAVSGQVLRDAEHTVLLIDRSRAPDCRNKPHITAEQVVANKPGVIIERWHVECCGTTKTYRMTFTPTPSTGGTDIRVQEER